ncbi:MAG: hypothetical protein ABFD50_22500, partial [Smithella sp.]
MSEHLSNIIDIMVKSDKTDEHLAEFVEQKREVDRYSKYVKNELFIVPYVPVVLILLYGCAILAQNSITARVFFLYGMLVCVIYLSIAAVTSGKIMFSYTELKKLNHDL